MIRFGCFGSYPARFPFARALLTLAGPLVCHYCTSLVSAVRPQFGSLLVRWTLPAALRFRFLHTAQFCCWIVPMITIAGFQLVSVPRFGFWTLPPVSCAPFVPAPPFCRSLNPFLAYRARRSAVSAVLPHRFLFLALPVACRLYRFPFTATPLPTTFFRSPSFYV